MYEVGTAVVLRNYNAAKGKHSYAGKDGMKNRIGKSGSMKRRLIWPWTSPNFQIAH
jgi:hypothetical protein